MFANTGLRLLQQIELIERRLILDGISAIITLARNISYESGGLRKREDALRKRDGAAVVVGERGGEEPGVIGPVGAPSKAAAARSRAIISGLLSNRRRYVYSYLNALTTTLPSHFSTAVPDSKQISSLEKNSNSLSVVVVMMTKLNWRDYSLLPFLNISTVDSPNDL